MIWEVGDDLDGKIDWDEFRGALARACVDKHNIEPSQLALFAFFVVSAPDTNTSITGTFSSALLSRPSHFCC